MLVINWLCWFVYEFDFEWVLVVCLFDVVKYQQVLWIWLDIQLGLVVEFVCVELIDIIWFIGEINILVQCISV